MIGKLHGHILLSFVLVFSGVWKQVDWLEFGSPFQNPTGKLALTSLAFWGQGMELLLFVILQPYSVKSRPKRDVFSFLLGALLISEVISFFATAVLGAYGKTRMFPVYTLAALSGHGFFSRLDYLHIINWTFACLLRCALFTWAAVLQLKELFPKGSAGLLRSAVIAVTAAAGLLLIRQENSFQWFYMIFASGIPLFVNIVLFPLILLWKSRNRRGRE